MSKTSKNIVLKGYIYTMYYFDGKLPCSYKVFAADAEEAWKITHEENPDREVQSMHMEERGYGGQKPVPLILLARVPRGK